MGWDSRKMYSTVMRLSSVIKAPIMSRCIPVIPRTYKLQEKPSALTRKHPALIKMKFLNCFLFFWAIFALLDPYRVCGSGYGSRDSIESGSNPNPDPVRIRIHKTGFQIKHPFKLLCVKNTCTGNRYYSHSTFAGWL
jgi:hypothetical protein